LFVIGDSISLHYGPYLEETAAGRYAYAHKRAEAPPRAPLTPTAREPGDRPRSSLDYPEGAFGENAGDSDMVLEYLASRPEQVANADVVLLNCGLHDLKVDKRTGTHQVSLDRYRRNLGGIVDALFATSASLVWCSTTPVHDATHAMHDRELTFSRTEADVLRYNLSATEVMRAAGVPVIDLHAFTLRLAGPDLAGLYADHVHFTPAVRAAQARFIAESLWG